MKIFTLMLSLVLVSLSLVFSTSSFASLSTGEILERELEFSKADAELRDSWIHEDIGTVDEKDLGTNKKERLNRLALDRFVDAAFSLSLLTNNPEFFSKFAAAERARWTGLAKKHAFLSENFKTLEGKPALGSTLRKSFLNNLVVNAFRVHALRQVKGTKEQIAEATLQINQAMTEFPLAGLLLLDVNGPSLDQPCIGSTFQAGLKENSLLDAILSQYIVKMQLVAAGALTEEQVLINLMDLVETTLNRWTGPWMTLLTESKDDFLAIDEKEHSSKKFVWFLEWGGYILSPYVGAAVTAVTTTNDVIDELSIRKSATLGYFSGLNDYYTFEIGKKHGVVKPLIHGLSNLGLGVMVAYSARSTYRAIKDGSLRESIKLENLRKYTPKEMAKSTVRAVKNTNRYALLLGFTNMFASGATFLYTSASQRNADLKTLFLNDGNFRRDFMFTMIGDFVLGFFAVDTGFLQAAIIQGAVTSFLSITATTLEAAGSGKGISLSNIDWNRVVFDSSYAAFIANAKFRYAALPLANIIQQKALAKVFTGEALRTADTLSRTGIGIVNNAIGNAAYVYMARQVERNELDRYIQQRMNESSSPIQN